MAEYLRLSPWRDCLFWWKYGYGVERNWYVRSTKHNISSVDDGSISTSSGSIRLVLIWSMARTDWQC